MRTIRSLTGSAALLAVIALATAGPASARAKAAHRYNSTIQSGPLATGSGYPNPGGTTLNVGTVDIPPFGTGAVVDHATITGHPVSNEFDFKGNEVDYFDGGTWRSKFTGTVVLQPNGAQQVTVTGRYVGGTGRYTGATGLYMFSGTTPPGSTVLSGHSGGWITF